MLAAGRRRGTTRTSPTRCSARSSSAISGTPFHDYVEERLLRPLGLERTTLGAGGGRPRCRTSSSRTPTPSGASRCSSSAARAASRGSAARSATSPAGARSSATPTERCSRPATVERDARPAASIAEPDWTLGWGLGHRALAARRAGLRRAHRRLARASSRSLVYSRAATDRRGRARRTRAPGRSSSATGLDARRGGARGAAARRSSAWAPEAAPPRRDRCRCSAAGGRRATSSSSAGAAGSWRRGSPAAPPERRARRSSSARARTASARVLGPRARRAAARRARTSDGEVVRLYWATYPFTARRLRSSARAPSLAVAGDEERRARPPRRTRRRAERPSQRRRAAVAQTMSATSDGRAAHRRQLDRPERERQRRPDDPREQRDGRASRAARPARSTRPRSRSRAAASPRWAMTIAPPCSAALPTIATITVATKNSREPGRVRERVERVDEDLADERGRRRSPRRA